MTAVELAGEQVDVIFEVNECVNDRIISNSVATLRSVWLLGESAVDITASTRCEPIPEWGYVPQGREIAQFADITTQVGQGVDGLSSLIGDVQAGRGTVGKLMTDERLYSELRRFAAGAGDLTDGLKIKDVERWEGY